MTIRSQAPNGVPQNIPSVVVPPQPVVVAAPPVPPGDPVTPVAPAAPPAPAPEPDEVLEARRQERQRMHNRVEESTNARKAAEERARQLEAELASLRSNPAQPVVSHDPNAAALQQQVQQMMQPLQQSIAQVAETQRQLAEAQRVREAQAAQAAEQAHHAQLMEQARLALIQRFNIPAPFQSRISGADVDALYRSVSATMQEMESLRQFYAPQPQPQQQVVAMPPAMYAPQAQPMVVPPGVQFITPTAPAPMPSQGGGVSTHEQVRAIATEQGVRSGLYAQQRDQIHQLLRSGGAPPPGSQFQMRPMVAPVVQQQWQPPIQHPYQGTAPMPAVAYQPVPGSGGAMQPTGLPTPTAYPAHVPQYAPQFQPPAPQQQFQPQPQYMAPQQQQFAPPMMQPVATPDAAVAQARAAAVAAIQATAANPQIAASRGISGAGNHQEYQPRSHVPNAHALTSGISPMVRNS